MRILVIISFPTDNVQTFAAQDVRSEEESRRLECKPRTTAVRYTSILFANKRGAKSSTCGRELVNLMKDLFSPLRIDASVKPLYEVCSNSIHNS